MAIRTIDLRTSLLGLLPDIRYPLSRLKAHPLGAPHVPAFENLRVLWTQVFTQDLGYVEAQAEAQARVDAADEALNDFASRFSKAVLTITKDNRSHALYVHFFGDKPLNLFKRPVLNEQLAAMTAWIPVIEASEHPALQAMAPELVALVEIADAAAKAKTDAKQQSRCFREVGERKKLVDRLNATRKEAHGLLAKLAHEQEGLPADFADQFFRSSKPEGEAPEEPETIATVRTLIEDLREDLTAAEARLAELEAEEAAAQQAAEALAADKAALAQIDKAAAELAQRRAALQARVEGK